MRIALGVEYDGSRYHGWQRQPDLHTVQGAVETALAKIVGKEIKVQCSGRTDTGVHAAAQVVHFDCDVERSLRAFVYGVNSQLPKDISVKWSHEVPDTFQARFSAMARHYRYVILNDAIRPGLLRSQLTWYYRPLNHKLMHEASSELIGEHDFTSFRSTECQSKSPVRNIHSISVIRHHDFVIIDIAANAFLHHMVRNIAGVLMAIGSERKPVQWIKDVLRMKDRSFAAETAPAYGLYLCKVVYPEEFELPETNLVNPLLLI